MREFQIVEGIPVFKLWKIRVFIQIASLTTAFTKVPYLNVPLKLIVSEEVIDLVVHIFLK